MFLPLLDQSKKNNGKGMIGMLVDVYTSDNQVLTYTITEVRRHVPKTVGFDDPLSRTDGDALAPDLRGAEGHADRAPGPRRAVRRPRRPIPRPPTRSPTRSSAPSSRQPAAVRR